MKNNRNPGLWLSMMAILGIMLLHISVLQKVLLVVLFLGGLVFWKRSLIYYMQANKYVVDPDSSKWAKAWPLYQKAIKNGLSTSYTVTAASMYLQRGDHTIGKQILENYLAKTEKKKDATLVAIAKTMVSMAYWIEGDLDKAIETVSNVYESGYKDKNLYINYGTYVLEKGDIVTARRLVEEATSFETTSPGIFDNRGWLYLLEGNWEEAIPLYTQLVGKGPKFPEPYVHAAQIKIHYGKVKDALELLDQAIEARFSNTSGMKKKTIELIRDRLANPETRMAAAREIDRNTAIVAKGEIPPQINDTYEKTEEAILPGFAKEPEQEKTVEKIITVEGERLPNTELTEADIEYAKKHNLE
ncbi:tetratricopeptide repeat protein [uncultured Sphaerochaeta sp.]|uniref:tetratricopeptide repeat protein n=1 Tax=uncultured Sphaerochaeta sp. TaxID=886478 RepID=UPI002A0A4B65|nr:tetratricopeptide repeat protein [uncultured Sphaerochaeta sp.]